MHSICMYIINYIYIYIYIYIYMYIYIYNYITYSLMAHVDKQWLTRTGNIV